MKWLNTKNFILYNQYLTQEANNKITRVFIIFIEEFRIQMNRITVSPNISVWTQP